MDHDQLVVAHDELTAVVAICVRDIGILKNDVDRLAGAIHARAGKLEEGYVSIRKSLARIETQLDEITPSVQSLIDIMRAWSRRRVSEDKAQ